MEGAALWKFAVQKGKPAAGMDSSSTVSPSTVRSWHLQESEPCCSFVGDSSLSAVITASTKYNCLAACAISCPFENSIAAANAASLQESGQSLGEHSQTAL